MHLCLRWNSAQSIVVLYMNLMIAYSVQMDQVMESFDSGHTFAIVHIAESCHNIWAYYTDLVTVNVLE